MFREQLDRFTHHVDAARAVAAAGRNDDAWEEYTNAVACVQALDVLVASGLLGPVPEAEIARAIGRTFPDSDSGRHTMDNIHNTICHETIGFAMERGLAFKAYSVVEILKSKRLTYELRKRVLEAAGQDVAGLHAHTDIADSDYEYILASSEMSTGILSFYISPEFDTLYVFSLHTESSSPIWHVRTLDQSASGSILSAARDYLHCLQKNDRRQAQKHLREALLRLGSELVRLVETFKRCGVNKLLLVPYGVLHQIPLHAAITELDGNARHLVDIFESVVFVPSLTLYAGVVTDKDIESWDWSILGCFDLDRLTYTSGLLCFFLYSYRLSASTCLLNPTLSAVVKHLNGKTQSHFDCHGTASEEDFLDSRLMLNDSALSFREVLDNLSFEQAQLVFLNACETGLNFNPDALVDEYYGLDGAVLAKGGLNVVSTLASVDDIAAFLLAVKFYENYQVHGMPVSAALQKAQEWLRDGGWTADEQLRLLLSIIEISESKFEAPVSRRIRACRVKLQRFLETAPAESFADEISWAQWKCSGYGENLIGHVETKFGQETSRD